jgi:ABC-type transport system substrate-binding protein
VIGRRQFGIGGAVLALAARVDHGARAQRSKSVLRVVPQAEPQVFDPHQSGVNATQENAALIYDTLFSWDADMVPRPQMVDRWTKSGDGLIYTFALRPGLKFHDLTPVTSRDAVATLRRLLVRDTQDQILAGLVAGIEAKDERSFALQLKAQTAPMARNSRARSPVHPPSPRATARISTSARSTRRSRRICWQQCTGSCGSLCRTCPSVNSSSRFYGVATSRAW